VSTDLTNVYQTLTNLSLFLVVVGSMLSMGLDLTLRQVTTR